MGIHCAGTTCASGDDNTCCDAKATCADSYEVDGAGTDKFDCDAGKVVSSSATCAEATCVENDTNKGSCCVAKAKCSTHSCPSTHVLKSSASTIDCAGETCASGDDSNCCDVKPACSAKWQSSDGTDATLSKCDVGNLLSSSATCVTAACDEASDKAACCVERQASDCDTAKVFCSATKECIVSCTSCAEYNTSPQINGTDSVAQPNDSCSPTVLTGDDLDRARSTKV